MVTKMALVAVCVLVGFATTSPAQNDVSCFPTGTGAYHCTDGTMITSDDLGGFRAFRQPNLDTDDDLPQYPPPKKKRKLRIDSFLDGYQDRQGR